MNSLKSRLKLALAAAILLSAPLAATRADWGDLSITGCISWLPFSNWCQITPSKGGLPVWCCYNSSTTFCDAAGNCICNTDIKPGMTTSCTYKWSGGCYVVDKVTCTSWVDPLFPPKCPPITP